MSKEETKVKEIVHLISDAFMALYNDDIESLNKITTEIREKVNNMKFEDFKFKDEMTEHMVEALLSGGKEVDEEETQKIVVGLFIRFVEISVRSCTSLLAYTMKDIVSNYAKQAFNDENN